MEKCGREEQICDIDRDLTGLTAVKPGAGWSKDVSAAEIWDGSGSEFDRPEMKKAALHEADAALISGGISHSLHGPVFAVVRARPADVLADVEGHGFDFAGSPPARPGEDEPVGIIDQIEVASA